MEPGWDSSSAMGPQVTGKTGLFLAVLAGLVYLVSQFATSGWAATGGLLGLVKLGLIVSSLIISLQSLFLNKERGYAIAGLVISGGLGGYMLVSFIASVINEVCR